MTLLDHFKFLSHKLKNVTGQDANKLLVAANVPEQVYSALDFHYLNKICLSGIRAATEMS